MVNILTKGFFMARCSMWLNKNGHRLIYSAGLAVSTYAAGFGSLYDFRRCQQTQAVGIEVYGYGVLVGLLAALKAYALPGKDLQCKPSIDESLFVAAEDMDPEMGDTRQQSLLDHGPKAVWYPWKYAYLLADHVVSFNNLCFMGNAIAAMVYAQQFATVDEANAKPFVAPGWSLAVYAAYYVLIDMAFISAVDGHTAHEEIFARHDKQLKQEHPDRLVNCLRQACWRSFLTNTQPIGRVLGSLSHTATEVLPLLTALNQWQRLRDMYNSNYQPLFWLAIGLKLMSFVTVFAQTYYYEGREQKEAYEQFTKDDTLNTDSIAVTNNRIPTKWRYGVDCFLQKTLWLSVVAHGAAEGLSWLLYPAARASASVRYTLAGLSVLNEIVGNVRSEYRETIEQVNKSIESYRSSHSAANDDASLQRQRGNGLGGQ